MGMMNIAEIKLHLSLPLSEEHEKIELEGRPGLDRLWERILYAAARDGCRNKAKDEEMAVDAPVALQGKLVAEVLRRKMRQDCRSAEVAAAVGTKMVPVELEIEVFLREYLEFEAVACHVAEPYDFHHIHALHPLGKAAGEDGVEARIFSRTGFLTLHIGVAIVNSRCPGKLMQVGSKPGIPSVCDMPPPVCHS